MVRSKQGACESGKALIITKGGKMFNVKNEFVSVTIKKRQKQFALIVVDSQVKITKKKETLDFLKIFKEIYTEVTGIRKYCYQINPYTAPVQRLWVF